MTDTNVPIKLKTALEGQSTTVQLERYVTVGVNDVRRRSTAPMIEDEASPELALHVYMEFTDIVTTPRLDLSTGALKFEYWRQVLKGNSRTHCDSTAQDVAGTTNDNFEEAMVIWIANYMEPTAYHEQSYELQGIGVSPQEDQNAYAMDARCSCRSSAYLSRY